MHSSAVFAFFLAFVAVQGYGNLRYDCTERRKTATSKPMPGQFVPLCETDGTYQIKQFHGSTCFCVDDFGSQLDGSVTPMHQCEKLDCTTFHTACQKERLQKLAQLRHIHLLGVSMPTCDRYGNYEAVQCREVSCWCVDKSGKALKGTQKFVTDGVKPVCDSNCIKDKIHSRELKQRNPPLLGVFEPVCSPNGDYAVKQCHEFMCFCVDPESGKKIKSVPRNEEATLQC